jgi:iron(III) transport system substrate-binding protein
MVERQACKESPRRVSGSGLDPWRRTRGAAGMLAAVAVSLCCLAAGPARADLTAIQDAARREGTLTWYTAHTDGETAEAMGSAFTQRYPGIKVLVIRTTAQVAYQRLLQDLKNNVIQCDVFSSTDVGHDEALKAQGKLVHYVPENESRISPEFRNFDPDGYYHATSADMVLITYNTRKVRPDAVPKNWLDLLDPKWKGQVSVGHPAFSGYVGTWVVMMRKLYGWSFFERLELNRPQIGRSINDTVTMLNSGERAVAASASGPTLESAARGNPVAVAYPTDGALLMIGPSAIMMNAPHPNAARLFMEFLLDTEAAGVSVRHGGQSLRPEVKPDRGTKPISEVKTIRPSVKEIVTGIPQVIDQWRETFGG